MTEQERLKMLQEKERQRAARTFPQSMGPKPGSVLEGRRGVADSTPLEQLTPEQRKAVDYTPHQPGVPRLPKSGMNVWDQSINDGAGGYVPRAPDMSQFDDFADQYPRIPLRPEVRADELQRTAPPEIAARSFGIDASAYGPEAQQQLEADAANVPGVRLLSERFMVIRQAMGVPTRRGAQAAAYVAGFVEDMKASGFVAQALQRHGVTGVTVAPATKHPGAIVSQLSGHA